MQKFLSQVWYKPYLQAATFGVTFCILIILVILTVKPVKEQIRLSDSLIEGLLVVNNGGFRNGGFVTIGHTNVNFSTDLIGGGSGSAPLRGIQNNSYVQAESVIFPTLFQDIVIVTKIREVHGRVIYERSVEGVINMWISTSLGLGACVGFLLAGMAFFFFQNKFQSKLVNE